MTRFSIYFTLLLPISIFAQAIPHTVGWLDINQDPVSVKQLAQTLEAPNGVYLHHEYETGDGRSTISFFDGTDWRELYNSPQPLQLRGATDDGAFALQDIDELSSERQVLYINRLTGRVDTVSTTPIIDAETIQIGADFYTLTDQTGIRKYAGDGEEVVVETELRPHNGINAPIAFTDRLIYVGGDHYYISDGTPGNTRLLFEDANQMVEVQGRLVHLGPSGLEAYDPTTDTVVSLSTDFPSITEDLNGEAYQPTLTPNGLLFIGRTPAGGRELFITDGTPAGTRALAEVTPGAEDGVGGDVLRGTQVDHTPYLLFLKGPGNESDEIWISDGTDAGTYRALTAPIGRINDSSTIRQQVTADGTLFIIIHTGSAAASNTLLYALSPGSRRPATLIADIPSSLSATSRLATLDNRLIIGGDGTNDTLLSYGPTPGDVVTIGSVNAYPDYLFSDDNVLLLTYRSESQSGVDTVYHTQGGMGDLTPFFAARFDDAGLTSYLHLFSIGDARYAHVFDPERGESILGLNLNTLTTEKLVDLYPDNGGSDIAHPWGLGNSVVWEVADDQGTASLYLHDSRTTRTVTSSTNGLSLGGSPPIGQIGSRYYFSNPSGNAELSEVDIRSGEARSIRSLYPEIEQTQYGNSIVFGDKIYTRRSRTESAPYLEVYEIIEIDPVANSSRILLSDSIVRLDYTRPSIDLVADGSVVYFVRVLSTGIGIGVLDPETGTSMTNSGRFSDFDISLNNIGGHVYASYLEDGRVEDSYILTPTDLGRWIFLGQVTLGFDYDGFIVFMEEENDDVWSTASADGAPFPVAGAFSISDSYEGIFLTDQNLLLFLMKSIEGDWEIYTSDGYIGDTHVIAKLPGDGDPTSVVAVGNYLSIIMDEQLLLFDMATAAFDTVDIQLPTDLTQPAQTVAGDRVYVTAIHPQFGKELHYISINQYRLVSGRISTGADDKGAANVAVSITDESGTRQTFTDTSGYYQFTVIAGNSYTVQPSPGECYANAAEPSQLAFTYSLGALPNLDFVLTPQPSPARFSSHLQSSIIRCGFTASFWLTVTNDGCSTEATTVRLDLLDLVTYSGTDTPPVAVDGTLLSWDSPALPPGGSYSIRLKLTLPDERFEGRQIPLLAYAEGGSTIDTFHYSQQLRCAIDPNDKLVSPSRTEPSNSNYTEFGEPLVYTVRFQNTGSDTAFNVRIEDQLSKDLDLTSFAPIAASAPYSATVDAGGLAVFRFDDIMLPDSNVNEIASHGFITFEIRAKEGLSEFTVTDNTAGIFFDFNAPVITNTVSSTFVTKLDADADGFNFYEECDDTNPAINPAAPEIFGNGIDEDCDGKGGTVSVTTPLPGRLSAFPNPTSDRLVLQYDRSARMEVRVYNVTGSLVATHTFSQETTLDMTNLPTGLYNFRVSELATGAVRTLRIVRN